jgi:transcriptional regulator with XRE-family HTH domain
MPNLGKGERAMTSAQFRAWRKSLGLKQKDAADVLGLKKRMIQYYERGERDGKTVAIPKTVRLACYAVLQGIADFDGTATKALERSSAGELEQ